MELVLLTALGVGGATVIGAVLCATLVGAIVGIPLIILGVTMMIRSLF